MRVCITASVLFAISLLVTPHLAADNGAKGNNLRFGVYTSDKPTVMFRKFRPILHTLEKRLSEKRGTPVKIHLRIFKSYEAGREGLVKGQVDFARLGPASYVLVKDSAPETSILAIEERGGETSFDGIIFTYEGSGLSRVEDIEGKKFAFGEQTSTIGRYLPQAFLAEKGIFARDLESFDYLGRHDRVTAAVAARKFHAGSAKESTFKKQKAAGLVELARVKNVTKPWVASPKLSADWKQSLRESLLELKEKDALRALGKKATGFRAADDSTYDSIRKAMKASLLFGDETVASNR